MDEADNKREEGLRVIRAQRIAKRRLKRPAKVLPVPRKGDSIDAVLLKRGLLNERYSVKKGIQTKGERK